MTVSPSIALSLALFAAAAGAQAPAAKQAPAAGETPAAAETPAAGETPVTREAPPAKQALESIETLGEANGQALACGAKQAAARARELMLHHSPRTSPLALGERSVLNQCSRILVASPTTSDCTLLLVV